MESKSWKVVTVVKNLSYELFFKCVFFFGGGSLWLQYLQKTKTKMLC